MTSVTASVTAASVTAAPMTATAPVTTASMAAAMTAAVITAAVAACAAAFLRTVGFGLAEQFLFLVCERKSDRDGIEDFFPGSLGGTGAKHYHKIIDQCSQYKCKKCIAYVLHRLHNSVPHQKLINLLKCPQGTAVIIAVRGIGIYIVSDGIGIAVRDGFADISVADQAQLPIVHVDQKERAVAISE